MESYHWKDEADSMFQPVTDALAEAESLRHALSLIMVKARLQFAGATMLLMLSFFGVTWGVWTFTARGEFYTPTLVTEIAPGLIILFCFVGFVSVRGLLMAMGVMSSSRVSYEKLSRDIRVVQQVSEGFL